MSNPMPSMISPQNFAIKYNLIEKIYKRIILHDIIITKRFVKTTQKNYIITFLECLRRHMSNPMPSMQCFSKR
jgi:hypothetical protein